MRSKLMFCVLALAVLIAGGFAPAAEAACDFEPKFCNKDTETNKEVLVTCSPKGNFVGGYVAFGSETVTLQEKGGTATAKSTVTCSAAGTPLTINVYDKDGNKTELGSFKSGKTKKDGTVVISTNLAQLGTQSLGTAALVSARERLDLDDYCSLIISEKDIVAFDAVLDIAETADPSVLAMTIVSLEETFAPVSACGTSVGPATLSLDPRYESTAVIDLEAGTVIGAMNTVVEVDGLGTFESQEYLDGTFDADTVTLRFDGDFEPYGRPNQGDVKPTATVNSTPGDVTSVFN